MKTKRPLGTEQMAIFLSELLYREKRQITLSMIVDKSFSKCYLLLTNSQNIVITKYDKFRGIKLQSVNFYSGHPVCGML